MPRIARDRIVRVAPALQNTRAVRVAPHKLETESPSPPRDFAARPQRHGTAPLPNAAGLQPRPRPAQEPQGVLVIPTGNSLGAAPAQRCTPARGIARCVTHLCASVSRVRVARKRRPLQALRTLACPSRGRRQRRSSVCRERRRWHRRGLGSRPRSPPPRRACPARSGMRPARAPPRAQRMRRRRQRPGHIASRPAGSDTSAGDELLGDCVHDEEPTPPSGRLSPIVGRDAMASPEATVDGTLRAPWPRASL